VFEVAIRVPEMISLRNIPLWSGEKDFTVLSTISKSESCQVDYTVAFVDSDIMHPLYSNALGSHKPGRDFKLNKSLYGCRAF